MKKLLAILIPLVFISSIIVGGISLASAEVSTYYLTTACRGNPELGATVRSSGPGTKGTVVGLTGGNGTGAYFGRNGDSTFAERLHADGWRTVSISWDDSWMKGPNGFKAAACRPARAIQWVNRNLHTGGTFAVTGNSGGSSQTAASLAFYPAWKFVDVAIPTGGPIHSHLENGCLAGSNGYSFDWGYGKGDSKIDSSWGYDDRIGPCYNNDLSFIPEWTKNSISTAGRHFYPDTKVTVINGIVRDANHGQVYADALAAAGTDVTNIWDRSLPHGVQKTDLGQTLIIQALNG